MEVPLPPSVPFTPPGRPVQVGIGAVKITVVVPGAIARQEQALEMSANIV
jgi:hypothetical protein